MAVKVSPSSDPVGHFYADYQSGEFIDASRFYSTVRHCLCCCKMAADNLVVQGERMSPMKHRGTHNYYALSLVRASRCCKSKDTVEREKLGIVVFFKFIGLAFSKRIACVLKDPKLFPIGEHLPLHQAHRLIFKATELKDVDDDLYNFLLHLQLFLSSQIAQFNLFRDERPLFRPDDIEDMPRWDTAWWQNLDPLLPGAIAHEEEEDAVPDIVTRVDFEDVKTSVAKSLHEYKRALPGLLPDQMDFATLTHRVAIKVFRVDNDHNSYKFFLAESLHKAGFIIPPPALLPEFNRLAEAPQIVKTLFSQSRDRLSGAHLQTIYAMFLRNRSQALRERGAAEATILTTPSPLAGREAAILTIPPAPPEAARPMAPAAPPAPPPVEDIDDAIFGSPLVPHIASSLRLSRYAYLPPLTSIAIENPPLPEGKRSAPAAPPLASAPPTIYFSLDEAAARLRPAPATRSEVDPLSRAYGLRLPRLVLPPPMPDLPPADATEVAPLPPPAPATRSDG